MCAQTPAVQLSAVHASWSSQSVAVVHGWQPPIASCVQAPAVQVSVVQVL